MEIIKKMGMVAATVLISVLVIPFFFVILDTELRFSIQNLYLFIVTTLFFLNILAFLLKRFKKERSFMGVFFSSTRKEEVDSVIIIASSCLLVLSGSLAVFLLDGVIADALLIIAALILPISIFAQSEEALEIKFGFNWIRIFNAYVFINAGLISLVGIFL